MDPLAERAAQWGVDREYTDARGELRSSPPEALAKILEALASGHANPDPTFPATFILRRGRQLQPPIPDLPPDAVIGWRVTSQTRTLAAGAAAPHEIVLPDDLPLGTYRLRLTFASSGRQTQHEATLLVCPECAFQGTSDNRLWALAVQLYGVRSKHNWGMGDFSDLADLITVAADHGVAAIGVNPLHALFDDQPQQASPYSPNSRLFLNVLYIDVSAIPEFPGLRSSGLEPEVRRARLSEQVDYPAVAAAKQRGFRLAYNKFREGAKRARRRDFEAFCAERGEDLLRFAAFEVLRRRFQRVWWEWPEEWRTPNPDALQKLRQTAGEEIGFYEYTQWIADCQLAACHKLAQRRGMPIGLYLDLAVGVQAGSADVWSHQAAILASLSVGAPPDLLNTAGQNWGLAGFNPAGLEARQFEPFRQMLKAAMRHAGAVRLDHVLGLKRLFVMPHDMSPREGAYLRFPFDALLAVSAQESQQNKSIVIGEDLGTVPEGFRETLADWGIWSYLVMLFERGPQGEFKPPGEYRKTALASFSTHDLPTFAGWRSGHDLDVKFGLNMDPGEMREERTAAYLALGSALAKEGLEGSDFPAVVRFLAAAPSRLLVVAIEDVLQIKDQPNLPGTIDEHPNWRQRLPMTIDELRSEPRLAALAEILRAMGRSDWTPSKQSHPMGPRSIAKPS
jgi:4-alpha-glucanotransferase